MKVFVLFLFVFACGSKQASTPAPTTPDSSDGMMKVSVESLSRSVDKGAPPSTEAPEDVAAPPADAKTTGSGLAYKVLVEGDNVRFPSAFDKVTVHYSGWTTDGELFDSSVPREKTAKFPLSSVVPGWTEGLQLISVGGTIRLWIPERLAYKGRAGVPSGMLVFDVQLIEIN